MNFDGILIIFLIKTVLNKSPFDCRSQGECFDSPRLWIWPNYKQLLEHSVIILLIINYNRN